MNCYYLHWFGPLQEQTAAVQCQVLPTHVSCIISNTHLAVSREFMYAGAFCLAAAYRARRSIHPGLHMRSSIRLSGFGIRICDFRIHVSRILDFGVPISDFQAKLSRVLDFGFHFRLSGFRIPISTFIFQIFMFPISDFTIQVLSFRFPI